jgi:hypothetical protein
MAKQAEIDEVEAHLGIPILRDWRSLATPIAHGFEHSQGIFFATHEVKDARKIASDKDAASIAGLPEFRYQRRPEFRARELK